MIYKQQHIQKQQNKTLLYVGIIVILGILGLIIWFVQQRIQQNPHAAASTVLSITSPSQTATVGQPVSAVISADPGTNKVSLIKLRLMYDGSKLQVTSAASSLVPNTDVFSQTLEPPTNTCNGTQCILSGTFSVGSDPTKALQTKGTVATVSFQAISGTNGSTTQVTFDPTTAVYSIGATDQASENVLSSTTPLSLTIGGGNVCVPNQSTCSWDSLDGITSYHYQVIESSSNNIIQEGDVSQTTATFPSLPGKTYTCNVIAVNICGKGIVGTGTSTCPAPSTTPTPTSCPDIGTVKNLHISCPNCNTPGTNQGN